MNYIMLKHAPKNQLAGKEDVMGEAAVNMLGPAFGKIVNIFIALQLIANHKRILVGWLKTDTGFCKTYPHLETIVI